MALPELLTERLRLRQLQQSDEDAIFFLRSDDEVNRYLISPRAKSVDDARAFISTITNLVAENKSFYWAISLKDDNKLIGTICFWNMVAEEQKAELGYVLHPSYQGKGLMHEAVAAAIEYGFGDMGLKIIEAALDPDNLKSIALLKRHGFVFAGEADGEVVYHLLKPGVKK